MFNLPFFNLSWYPSIHAISSKWYQPQPFFPWSYAQVAPKTGTSRQDWSHNAEIASLQAAAVPVNKASVAMSKCSKTPQLRRNSVVIGFLRIHKMDQNGHFCWGIQARGPTKFPWGIKIRGAVKLQTTHANVQFPEQQPRLRFWWRA